MVLNPLQLDFRPQVCVWSYVDQRIVLTTEKEQIPEGGEAETMLPGLLIESDLFSCSVFTQEKAFFSSGVTNSVGRV